MLRVFVKCINTDLDLNTNSQVIHISQYVTPILLGISRQRTNVKLGWDRSKHLGSGYIEKTAATAHKKNNLRLRLNGTCYHAYCKMYNYNVKTYFRDAQHQSCHNISLKSDKYSQFTSTLMSSKDEQAYYLNKAPQPQLLHHQPKKRWPPSSNSVPTQPNAGNGNKFILANWKDHQISKPNQKQPQVICCQSSPFDMWACTHTLKHTCHWFDALKKLHAPVMFITLFVWNIGTKKIKERTKASNSLIDV